jgi:glutaredoxin 2
MLESNGSGRYIDGRGDPVLAGLERKEIAAWADVFVGKSAARLAALSVARAARIRDGGSTRSLHPAKRKAVGDFVELRANTRQYIKDLMPDLEALDRMIESPLAINGALSLDDIRVLPLLRSVAAVKGLRFPRKVRDYFGSMMSRIHLCPRSDA